MTQQRNQKSPLKVSQPDLVEGKDGPELRGVFCRDPSPEMSWFAINWDEVGEILTIEFHASAIASELEATIETALEGIGLSAGGGNPAASGRLVLKRKVPTECAGGVLKRLGEVFGAAWKEPMVQLLAARPSAGQPRRAMMWYGVPREQIQWYPLIDPGRCDGCGKCAEFCKNGVLRLSGDHSRVEVANPFNCLVGCNSCASKCPTDAIQFPPREFLQTFCSGWSC